jgi:hypothetical protein
LVEWLVHDVRYAVRGLRRSPLFAASVAATIGLGLGILCSAFTILNAYLLRPIDLPEAHQLYSLSWCHRAGDKPVGGRHTPACA